MDNHLEDILFHQYIRIALVSVTISIAFLAHFDLYKPRHKSTREVLRKNFFFCSKQMKIQIVQSETRNHSIRSEY